MIKKLGFFLVILFLITANIYSQKIEYRSDKGVIKPGSPNDITLLGNVVFKHKGLVMYCDSAVYNKQDNYFYAFSRVNIYDNDTVHLTGDNLHYDGNTRIAEISGDKVILEDGKVTLQTTYLVLDREDNTARYITGADIWDEKNTLTSKEGIYFIDDKIFNFLYNVEVTTPKATINSDSLIYNANTEKATFIGKTDIVTNDSTKINTTQGTYNTKTDEVYSDKNAKIYTKDQYITADTIYYNKKEKNGYAYGGVYMKDTTNDMEVFCDKATLTTIDTLSSSILTGHLLCKQIDKTDTLYFHSDTVKINMDTTFDAKDMYAYYHCKFFRSDIQGAAEMIYYNIKDSVLTMTKKPILWAEDSQMTSDTIVMLTQKKGVKEMFMYPNSLIVQNSDTLTQEYFNQVFGKHLHAFFTDNKVTYAEIVGNSESIYYVWDEKKGKKKELIGLNIGKSRKINLYFNKGKIKKMSAIDNPDYYIDDEKKINEGDKHLKGFIWQEKEKPKTKEDIFIQRQ